jgi:hypothetical protein
MTKKAIRTDLEQLKAKRETYHRLPFGFRAPLTITLPQIRVC